MQLDSPLRKKKQALNDFDENNNDTEQMQDIQLITMESQKESDTEKQNKINTNQQEHKILDLNPKWLSHFDKKKLYKKNINSSNQQSIKFKNYDQIQKNKNSQKSSYKQQSTLKSVENNQNNILNGQIKNNILIDNEPDNIIMINKQDKVEQKVENKNTNKTSFFKSLFSKTINFDNSVIINSNKMPIQQLNPNLSKKEKEAGNKKVNSIKNNQINQIETANKKYISKFNKELGSINKSLNQKLNQQQSPPLICEICNDQIQINKANLQIRKSRALNQNHNKNNQNNLDLGNKNDQNNFIQYRESKTFNDNIKGSDDPLHFPNIDFIESKEEAQNSLNLKQAIQSNQNINFTSLNQKTCQSLNSSNIQFLFNAQKCQKCNNSYVHKHCLVKQNKTQYQCKKCLRVAWFGIINQYSQIKNQYIYRLKVLIRHTQFGRLSENQLKLIQKLINDLSFNFEEKISYTGQFFMKKFIYDIPVFSPSSLFMKLWFVLIFTTITYKVFEIPFVIAFEQQEYIKLTYQIPILIILMMEIFISFRIGYYEDGIIVLNKEKVFNNYIQSKFKQDVFFILCILFSLMLDYQIIAIPFILKQIQANKILNQAGSIFDFQRKSGSSLLFEMVKLLNMVFFVAHFMACGFYFISHYQEVNENWIEHFNFTNETVFSIYITGLYYSFICMSTIGFGDIYPVTKYERIFIMVFTLLSCGIFAYSLNIITSVFQERAQQIQAFRNQKYDILSYLNRRNIKSELQIRVIRNLEHQFQMDQQGLTKSHEILQGLSNVLVKDIKKDFYLRVIKEQMIFTANFSESFLNDLCLCMQEQTLAPQGSMLGVKDFITDRNKNTSARSSKITQLIYINQQDFIEVIENHPVDHERFYQLRDQFEQEQDHQIRYLYEKCQFCERSGHNIQKCPFLHLFCDKKWIIYKKQYLEKNTFQQLRTKLPDLDLKLKRRKKLKFHTFYKIQIQQPKQDKYNPRQFTQNNQQKICQSEYFSNQNNEKIIHYQLEDTRINAILIRKKMVLEYIINKLQYENDQILPMDFFQMVAKVITDYYTEQLTDQELFQNLPGIIYDKSIDNQKQYKFKLIQGFDYNYSKDENSKYQNLISLYTQAKSLNFDQFSSSGQLKTDQYVSMETLNLGNPSSQKIKQSQQKQYLQHQQIYQENEKLQNQQGYNLFKDMKKYESLQYIDNNLLKFQGKLSNKDQFKNNQALYNFEEESEAKEETEKDNENEEDSNYFYSYESTNSKNIKPEKKKKIKKILENSQNSETKNQQQSNDQTILYQKSQSNINQRKYSNSPKKGTKIQQKKLIYTHEDPNLKFQNQCDNSKSPVLELDTSLEFQQSMDYTNPQNIQSKNNKFQKKQVQNPNNNKVNLNLLLQEDKIIQGSQNDCENQNNILKINYNSQKSNNLNNIGQNSKNQDNNIDNDKPEVEGEIENEKNQLYKSLQNQQKIIKKLIKLNTNLSQQSNQNAIYLVPPQNEQPKSQFQIQIGNSLNSNIFHSNKSHINNVQSNYDDFSPLNMSDIRKYQLEIYNQNKQQKFVQFNKNNNNKLEVAYFNSSQQNEPKLQIKKKFQRKEIQNRQEIKRPTMKMDATNYKLHNKQKQSQQQIQQSKLIDFLHYKNQQQQFQNLQFNNNQFDSYHTKALKILIKYDYSH
ncbi:Cyclic nucleotide-binding protein [Pseudocohnilembus persalinus]|uniref:Cyclic nucleotide-binding protein n=1 Tax=Pseudocohnilembus persalinus TaxID=266149 RepID=A0A0V0QZH9_PSEPJ|nr:Cyclic nucleotide-binding protein [Pseudocohnilembus persalinus]|eukprot:KRX07633.1 Cyclic nucleotide-binding protein [Pseudocohnilembus persalinus]